MSQRIEDLHDEMNERVQMLDRTVSLVFEALHRHEVDGEALHLLPQMQHRIQLNRNDHVSFLQERIAG